MSKIILGSTSPRRIELIKKLGYEVEIVPPDYNENIINKTFSYELIEQTAENKNISVRKDCKIPAIIVSADTVVVYNDTILGKPKNFEEAYKMLSALNGNTHKVVTSVCVYNMENGKKIIKSETSEVTFNKMPDETVKNYINKFKPYDKAGSYGIQELEENFIKEIKGDYDNIVGLPCNTLKSMLKDII